MARVRAWFDRMNSRQFMVAGNTRHYSAPLENWAALFGGIGIVVILVRVVIYAVSR